MARLPALVDDLAAHDPRERASIDLIARKLREEGLIRTTSRGRGAATMTSQDASALLIAICVADSPTSAAVKTREYASLPTDAHYRNDLLSNRGEFPEVFGYLLEEDSLLGVAVALIDYAESIASFRDGVRHVAGGDFKSPNFPTRMFAKRVGDPFRFFMGFRLNYPSAFLGISWPSIDKKPSFFALEFGETEFHHARNHPHDKSVQVELGFEPFLRLRRLLGSSEPRPGS